MKYFSEDGFRKNGWLSLQEQQQGLFFWVAILSPFLVTIGLVMAVLVYSSHHSPPLRAMQQAGQDKFGNALATDCQVSTYGYRQLSCSLIVEEQRSKGHVFILKGRNTQTSQPEIFGDVGEWYSTFCQSIDVGDTVIKPKGQIHFSIHKKDTVLVISYQCEGQIYQ